MSGTISIEKMNMPAPQKPVEATQGLILRDFDTIMEVKRFIKVYVEELLTEHGSKLTLKQARGLLSTKLNGTHNNGTAYLKKLFKEIPSSREHFIKEVFSLCDFYTLEMWEGKTQRGWVLSKFIKDFNSAEEQNGTKSAKPRKLTGVKKSYKSLRIKNIRKERKNTLIRGTREMFKLKSLKVKLRLKIPI